MKTVCLYKPLMATLHLVLLVVLLASSGCKLEYSDIVLHKVDCCDIADAVQGKVTIGFGLDVENPNSFNIKVKKFDVNVKINGVDVGKAEGNQKFTILKHSRSTYKLYVTADIKKILQGSLSNLGAFFGKGKQLEAEIEGEIKASAMGITKTIPVSGKYPLKLN